MEQLIEICEKCARDILDKKNPDFAIDGAPNAIIGFRAENNKEGRLELSRYLREEVRPLCCSKLDRFAVRGQKLDSFLGNYKLLCFFASFVGWKFISIVILRIRGGEIINP